MTRRSLTDDAWRDEVIRRWQRRRWQVQQRQQLVADLKVALLPPIEGFAAALNRLLRHARPER